MDLFYSGLSIFIQKYVNVDAEVRLNKAYARSAAKFRQKLSIEKFVAEEDVKSELRNCLLPLAQFATNDLMVIRATDELNAHIDAAAWRVRGRVDKISVEQMKEVLVTVPDDMAAFLKDRGETVQAF